MSAPEDNPADEVQPTREEWEAWEEHQREQAARRAADEDYDPEADDGYEVDPWRDVGGEG